MSGQTIYSSIDELGDLYLFASSWLDIPVVARLDTNDDNFINFTDFAVLAKNR